MGSKYEIDWHFICFNTEAIPIIEKNLNKTISWSVLNTNPNAIEILKKHPNKIDYLHLSQNPNAIDLLEQNQEKISYFGLSKNPEIFIIDYDALRARMDVWREELLAMALNPSRVEWWRSQGFFFNDLF